ncbi:Druantia anti-phage system protein DruA [Thermococcus sp.]|uniref:Druantia anti-phage system protein DruA n=1 Tax=Thermococcus sp. TaxID=35749 RepID=UPI0025ED2AAB|nr:Druantia anti-phage system protein DruA [Thermococcus sp.]
MNTEDIEVVRQRLLQYFQDIGFSVNPHLKPSKSSKEFLRALHSKRRLEQLQANRKFLEHNFPLIREYYKEVEISIEDIKLELRFVDASKQDDNYILFKWWNLVWWSLPYERSIGRKISYLVFDKYHNLPFGLVVLQSPVMYCRARDEYLGITKEKRDYWINQSLYGQRVGALPPYNRIFGGKLVSMSLVSAEIREEYHRKYHGRKTLKQKRVLPSNLLFTYTLSAYGRSKIYEDLYFKGEPLSVFAGYSRGAGTFHISDSMYQELLRLLGENVKKSVFVSPSRKMKLLAKAFRIIGLPGFEYHNIKRGVYIFPHVYNLREIISSNEAPRWKSIKFKELYQEWMENYLSPKIKTHVIKDNLNDILKRADYPFM